MTVGLVVEIAVNLVQQLLFIGFLYLFFDKSENRVKNITSFLVAVLILFAMANYFTFNEMTFNHMDAVITIVIMLGYSVFFLKGELYLRIIMPLVSFGLNMLIAFAAIFLMSSITGKTMEESVAFSTAFRYIYLVVVEATYIFILWLILRIRKKNITLSNRYDIFAFIVIPVLCMLAMYTDVFIYQIVNFDSHILLLIVINLIVLVIVSIMVWFLLIKISNDNEIKTELLLSNQREEMYKTSVISTNEQIEKLSQIRHDIKNNALAVSTLIKEGEYQKAKTICDSIAKSTSSYTPVHCQNPVLNAILNVEIDKATSYNIDFTYDISDTLSFMDDADVVSIIGNLCDNAIEYLSTVPTESRKMDLNISVYRDFSYINCNNTITSSVLEHNPRLNTSKDDNLLHGKGIKILRSVAERYNGEVIVKEEQNEFSVSVIIHNQN